MEVCFFFVCKNLHFLDQKMHRPAVRGLPDGPEPVDDELRGGLLRGRGVLQGLDLLLEGLHPGGDVIQDVRGQHRLAHVVQQGFVFLLLGLDLLFDGRREGRLAVLLAILVASEELGQLELDGLGKQVRDVLPDDPVQQVGPDRGRAADILASIPCYTKQKRRSYYTFEQSTKAFH